MGKNTKKCIHLSLLQEAHSHIDLCYQDVTLLYETSILIAIKLLQKKPLLGLTPVNGTR